MAKIWVKATQLGFDGMQRQRVGAKFQIEESAFSAKWMKRIKPPSDHDDDELDAEEAGAADKKSAAKAGSQGKPKVGSHDKPKAGARPSDESKI